MTANDKTAVNGKTAASASKASIIIVDDEPMVVTSITAFLELDGQFGVLGLTDPAEALRVAQSNRVDVAICDYRMPTTLNLSNGRTLENHASAILSRRFMSDSAIH